MPRGWRCTHSRLTRCSVARIRAWRVCTGTRRSARARQKQSRAASRGGHTCAPSSLTDAPHSAAAAECACWWVVARALPCAVRLTLRSSSPHMPKSRYANFPSRVRIRLPAQSTPPSAQRAQPAAVGACAQSHTSAAAQCKQPACHTEASIARMQAVAQAAHPGVGRRGRRRVGRPTQAAPTDASPLTHTHTPSPRCGSAR